MLRRFHPCLVLALVPFCWLALAAQPPRPTGSRPQNRPPLPEGTVAHRNLSYLPDDHPRHKLDLYLPKDGKNLPLVVWIHGGGWQNGSKERCPALPLVAKGFAVASINYRLTDVACFPAQIEDCKAAIRWLRAHASKYGYDPKRIGVWGASAGGHLVALLGTSGGVKELEGKEGHLDQASNVQAVCDWFGPTDFTGMISREVNNPNGAVFKLLGGPISEKKELARLASPVQFVDKDDPPFLIMHGDEDRLVPVRQSELLHEKLKEAGVASELVVVKGAAHGLPGPENFRKVESFFRDQLKP